MASFQCPECELRFRFATELEEHLRDDHPDFHIEPKSAEDAILLEAHNRRIRNDRGPKAASGQK
jgi:hypothetical protein